MITLTNINFDNVVADYEFEKASKVREEDYEKVAFLCCKNKDKILDRIAEAVLKIKYFSYIVFLGGETSRKTGTLDEYLEYLKSQNRAFEGYYSYPGHSGFLANNTGLVFEYVEEKYNAEQGQNVTSTFYNFVPFSEIRKALIYTYVVVKNLNENVKNTLSYFTQNPPRTEVTSFWYDEFEVEEFKKKSLFGKGYAKLSYVKPQLLLDIEERINNLLKDRGIMVFISPELFMAFDDNFGCSNVICSWDYNNEKERSESEEQYLKNQNDFIFSHLNEDKVYITFNHNFKEESEVYSRSARLRSKLTFMRVKN